MTYNNWETGHLHDSAYSPVLSHFPFHKKKPDWKIHSTRTAHITALSISDKGTHSQTIPVFETFPFPRSCFFPFFPAEYFTFMCNVSISYLYESCTHLFNRTSSRAYWRSRKTNVTQSLERKSDWEHYNLTERLTIFEPQNTDNFYAPQKRQSTDFVAEELQNFGSGCWMHFGLVLCLKMAVDCICQEEEEEWGEEKVTRRLPARKKERKKRKGK